MSNWQKGGFGLYVHWPFCVSKCPYCDFNSHVVAQIDPNWQVSRYLAALAQYGRELPGRTLNSIFFGGGTPSTMDPAAVGAIIDAAQRHWTFANDIEITLEANPGSVDAARFAGYAQAGVGRVSLGIQALNDTDLRRLGRTHDTREALRALDIAQAQFDRVSFDLIYARQGQTLAAWEDELARALAFGTEHLSLYQLTIEPGTVFGKRAHAGQLRDLPDEDLAADMFEATQIMCDSNGLQAYEVSNHARIGAHSVHNMIYWQAGDYVGIGPGAHGRITLGHTRFATETPQQPGAWAARTRNNGTGESLRAPLSLRDQAEEYLLMGLRTRRGVELDRLGVMGAKLEEASLQNLEALDLVERSDGHLRATAKGMPVLNAILRELALTL